MLIQVQSINIRDLNLFAPGKKVEELLLLITQNTELLIKQTKLKRRETWDFKKSKLLQTSSFDTPLELKGEWITGLIGWEVLNTVFQKIEKTKNSKF